MQTCIGVSAIKQGIGRGIIYSGGCYFVGPPCLWIGKHYVAFGTISVLLIVCYQLYSFFLLVIVLNH
jgi:hypothetical protein